jgi:hypothetical protein
MVDGDERQVGMIAEGYDLTDEELDEIINLVDTRELSLSALLYLDGWLQGHPEGGWVGVGPKTVIVYLEGMPIRWKVK